MENTLKVFTNNTFKGHYPVGTAAVVYATDAIKAAAKLSAILERDGMEQTITPDSMVMFPTPKRAYFRDCVRILQEGDY